MTIDPGQMVPQHLQPVEVLIYRAAKALYADAVEHVRDAQRFEQLHPYLRSQYRRRARVALMAAFPSLMVAGDAR